MSDQAHFLRKLHPLWALSEAQAAGCRGGTMALAHSGFGLKALGRDADRHRAIEVECAPVDHQGLARAVPAQRRDHKAGTMAVLADAGR